MEGVHRGLAEAPPPRVGPHRLVLLDGADELLLERLEASSVLILAENLPMIDDSSAVDPEG